MKKFPRQLSDKLMGRQQQQALRKLPDASDLIDFSSNDYLGLAKSETLFDAAHAYLTNKQFKVNGATGSRLLSGNHFLFDEAEKCIAAFHQTEAALLFNSGYDANLGFFSAVPQKGDVILYDELCHASIRDGIRLSNAKSYKFPHNDFEDLERLILKCKTGAVNCYIATESVFSMDGDSPNLDALVALCEQYGCLLIVDEAHALGVFGDQGCGLIQRLGLQDKVFARLVTFGKGLGCHGAAILGPMELKHYLINFARSFIYTTALPPHSVATILEAYRRLQQDNGPMERLRNNILHFNQQKNQLGLKPLFVYGKSPIQCAIIPGNEKVKDTAKRLQQKGFDVRPILSPTVPEGQERLRICLHSYNSESEISALLSSMAQLLL